MTTGPEKGRDHEDGTHDAASVVEEFAATWERMIDSVAFPSPDAFLQSVDQQSQDELRATLSHLDRQYRQRLAEKTFDNSAGSTDAQAIGRTAAGDTGGAAPDNPSAEFDEAGPTAPNWGDPTLIARAPGAADDSRAPGSVEQIDAPADGGPLSPTRGFTAPGRPLAVGRLPDVPGYELEGEIGRGGMGVVYRSRQIGLNRIVALKMIRGGEFADDDELARFQSEAEAVAHLQHPNIVQVFDTGSSGGLPYFSLEFIEGRSLEAEREGRPMEPARAAGLLVTMARAVHYAHERGIVHRDLKPSNVLLTAGGVPKIMDFGLAKRVEADSSRTKTGVVVGTPSYMSPEQAWGGTTVGPAADIYALGATLYALLTGRPPFQGPTPVETILQVQRDEPVPPSRLQPGIPRDLETICQKALQKDPAARYADAAALADDLERYLRGEPILARPVSRAERMWRWCRRNPSLSLSAGAALVLALCLMIGGPTAAAVIYRQKQAVDAARSRAVQNELIANRNETQAIRNEQLAQQNAETARTQRNLALSSLNTLADTAFNDLSDRPDMQEIQRKLLRTTMNGLSQVADKGGGAGGGGWSKDVVLARTQRNLGNLLLQTGLAEDAYSQFLRMHQIVVELAKVDNPQQPEVPHLNLGRSYSNLGRAEMGMGDAAQAKEDFLKSLFEMREALPLARDKLFTRQQIAEVFGRLGSACRTLGRPHESLCWYRASQRLRREWANAAPKSPDALRELAGVQIALAGLAVDQGQLDEAIDQYRQHLQTLEDLAQANPTLVSSRGNVAFVHNQIGIACLFDDRAGEARAEFQQAVDTFEDLAAQDAENALVRRKLGDALYGLAAACLATQDADGAAEHFASCLSIRRQLAEQDPDDLILQGAFALALARAGHRDEADATAARIAELAPNDAGRQYVVAGVYALCSEGAPADTDYAQRSVAVLAQAVRVGFKTRFLIQVDPDLAAVRSRADFQALLNQLPQQEDEPCPEETLPEFLTDGAAGS